MKTQRANLPMAGCFFLKHSMTYKCKWRKKWAVIKRMNWATAEGICDFSKIQLYKYVKIMSSVIANQIRMCTFFLIAFNSFCCKKKKRKKLRSNLNSYYTKHEKEKYLQRVSTTSGEDQNRVFTTRLISKSQKKKKTLRKSKQSLYLPVSWIWQMIEILRYVFQHQTAVLLQRDRCETRLSRQSVHWKFNFFI